MERDLPTSNRYSSKRTLNELVSKNATSASRLKKRVRHARKTILKVVREQRRFAHTQGLYPVAVTLTYAPGTTPDPKDISRFLTKLRTKLHRIGRKLPYIWTVERSEVNHYHLLLWLPRGFRVDKELLNAWWLNGSTWIERCRNALAWAKYITKPETKSKLPTGMRIFSFGGLDEGGSEALKRSRLPLWLIRIVGSSIRPIKVRGGWIVPETGEIFQSPYMWTPLGCRLKLTITG